MITQLFIKAIEKAGNQTKLAEMLGIKQGRLSEYKNYKSGDPRKPPDEMILALADYLGLDKGETLYKAKLELEPEKAGLWGFLVRSAGLEPTPQASEKYVKMAWALFNLLISNQLFSKHYNKSYNLNEHNAVLC